MNADGTSPMQLTSFSFFVYTAKYSPDGTRIGWAKKSSPSTRIWMMSADGTEISPVVKARCGQQIHTPTWSADGVRIAFVSNDGGSTSIRSASVAASSDGIELLSVLGAEVFGLNWGPVGVAYVPTTSTTIAPEVAIAQHTDLK